MKVLKSEKKEFLRKAIVFIDANNWYHNVKHYLKPSDVDITKVVKIISEKFKLEILGIRWYASMPSIADGELMYNRHRAWLGKLSKKGVKIITRKLQRLSNQEILKRKKETIDNLDICDNCKPLIEAHFLDLADIKKKEKGIDTWIAVDLLDLSLIENKCDVCVLISGDTDFVPPLNIIKNKKKEVISAMTPWGYSSELRTKFPYFMITKDILIKCLNDYEKEVKQ